ncbi:MAG: hypothetical protein FJZ56_01080 [Chlamydiae bacterium]|nr:hypothetical protein [Chlamydiota bacterium]
MKKNKNVGSSTPSCPQGTSMATACVNTALPNQPFIQGMNCYECLKNDGFEWVYGCIATNQCDYQCKGLKNDTTPSQCNSTCPYKIGTSANCWNCDTFPATVPAGYQAEMVCTNYYCSIEDCNCSIADCISHGGSVITKAFSPCKPNFSLSMKCINKSDSTEVTNITCENCLKNPGYEWISSCVPSSDAYNCKGQMGSCRGSCPYQSGSYCKNCDKYNPSIQGYTCSYVCSNKESTENCLLSGGELTTSCELNACCNEGDTGCNGNLCSEKEVCSNGICCPTNQVGVNGLCCDPTLVCNGNCCQSGQVCSNGICCPSGYVELNGLCSCPSGYAELNGQCCNQNLVCNGICCSSSQVCSNGICCPTGLTGCNNSCCDTSKGEVCSSGVCCQSGSRGCGNNCCPNNQICALDTCCLPGQLSDYNGCCWPSDCIF